MLKERCKNFEELEKLINTNLPNRHEDFKDYDLFTQIKTLVDNVHNQINDTLTKDKNLSEKLEEFRELFTNKKTELQDIKDKIASVNASLESIKNDIEAIENKSESFVFQKNIEDLKMKLSLYRKLTGVYFDYKAPSNVISGFIGVQSRIPSENKVVPIYLKKQLGETQVSEKISQMIDEACLNDTENLENGFCALNIAMQPSLCL